MGHDVDENELRSALQAELHDDELKKLPEDFFIRLRGFIAQLLEDQNHHASSDLKALLKAKEQQVARMRDALIKIRLLKMFSLLLSQKRTPLLSEKYRLLTKEEKQLFQEITNAMNAFWTSVASVDIQKDIAYKEAKTTDVHEKYQKESEKRLVLVEILEYMPKYHDNEGHVRGPHEPNDIVSVSEEIAFKILIPKGKARAIEISREKLS